jgi:hypothetical protein
MRGALFTTVAILVPALTTQALATTRDDQSLPHFMGNRRLRTHAAGTSSNSSEALSGASSIDFTCKADIASPVRRAEN